MKHKDLVRKLQQAGWVISHGKKHDMAKYPNSSIKIPIPRHNEIDECTTKEIIKDAGLK